MPEEQQIDGLKEIYSQHWEHLRHLGNERLAVTSFYIAVFGFAVPKIVELKADQAFLRVALLLFLILLSFVGFIIMARSMMSLWYHYLEIVRLTPKLYPDAKIDYEGSHESLIKEIYEIEKPYRHLNAFVIWLSTRQGVMLPLTLLFPLFFVFGLIIAIGLLIGSLVHAW